jgi:hypothetical protein
MIKMQSILGKLPLTVIQFPSGTWGFVGAVPVELKWITDDPELIRIASDHGAGLARSIAKNEGKVFETCTWPTREAAIAAAVAAGHTVGGMS